MSLPAGLYDVLLTQLLAQQLDNRADRHKLDEGDAHHSLTQHFATVLARALGAVKQPTEQVRIVSQLLQTLQELGGHIDDATLASPPQRLAQIGTTLADGKVLRFPEPIVPLGQSAFVTNTSDAPSIGALLRSEFASATRVDAIVAFIKMAGLRVLQEPIREFLARGGTFRVLTTTYLGASGQDAIDWLCEAGAQVRVSYDAQSTRLHAKAWMFERAAVAPVGAGTTVYVGSSNLSRAALVDGLEWNVRLSARETPALVQSMRAAFETFWASNDFEVYDPTRDRVRLQHALRQETASGSSWSGAFFEIRPRPYQQVLLDRLDVARNRHGRQRTLLVAATGTGKTVMAALDFQRLQQQHGALRLLYVAHRAEILEQALTTYRGVLAQGSFGELHVGNHRAQTWQHVFASLQSLSPEQLDPLAFDVVVVDEFHHAAAPTWKRLIAHLQPRFLLGLTATPERGDGIDVLAPFDGQIAAELRLWDALAQGDILAPFQYYAVADNTDLQRLRWENRGYNTAQLSNLYTGNDARLRLILAALRLRLPDASQMRAIGFCVSVAHAEFMAQRFSQAGIPSQAVTGQSPAEERRAAQARLQAGEVCALFTVDLYNEGVDVPHANTLLFLRPTESATLFLQQLGRGLRRAPGKDACLVLDFVGRPHKQFRFDVRYRALLGTSRKGLEQQIQEGFPYLPQGCHLELDAVSQQYILSSIKSSLASTFRARCAELAALARDLDRTPTLTEFLAESMLTLEDVYQGKPTWYDHLVGARLVDAPAVVPDSSVVGVARKRLNRLLHVQDVLRVRRYLGWLANGIAPQAAALEPEDRTLLTMLYASLFGAAGTADWQATLDALFSDIVLRRELPELLKHLDESAQSPTRGATPGLPSALQVHADYTRDEVVAAFGGYDVARPYLPREGVWYREPWRTDVLFVTLHKTEKHFSPSTRYEDYPISPTRFHWQSQSTTSAHSEVGQRYQHHEALGSRVVLFVRSHRKNALGLSTPFTYLGPVRYVEHTGSRPLSIVWELAHAMPPSFFRQARVAAG